MSNAAKIKNWALRSQRLQDNNSCTNVLPEGFSRRKRLVQAIINYETEGVQFGILNISKVKLLHLYENELTQKQSLMLFYHLEESENYLIKWL